jgi:hypothetical protein
VRGECRIGLTEQDGDLVRGEVAPASLAVRFARVTRTDEVAVVPLHRRHGWWDRHGVGYPNRPEM